MDSGERLSSSPISFSSFSRFLHLAARRYLVYANGICAAYSLLSAFFTAKAPRPATPPRAWALFFCDQVNSGVSQRALATPTSIDSHASAQNTWTKGADVRAARGGFGGGGDPLSDPQRRRSGHLEQGLRHVRALLPAGRGVHGGHVRGSGLLRGLVAGVLVPSLQRLRRPRPFPHQGPGGRHWSLPQMSQGPGDERSALRPSLIACSPVHPIEARLLWCLSSPFVMLISPLLRRITTREENSRLSSVFEAFIYFAAWRPQICNLLKQSNFFVNNCPQYVEDNVCLSWAALQVGIILPKFCFSLRNAENYLWSGRRSSQVYFRRCRPSGGPKELPSSRLGLKHPILTGF